MCLPLFLSISRPIRFLEGKVNPSGKPISYVPSAAFDYVIRKLSNWSGISITDRCAALRLAERHWRFAIPEDKEVEMIFWRLAYWLWLACFSLEDLIANMNGMIGIKSMTIYDNKCPLHFFQCDEMYLKTAIFRTEVWSMMLTGVSFTQKSNWF